ncbi:MAG: putative Na+(Li+)/H+ antiporter, partial [Nitrososphaeraceae archaeon]|nr:putative Na+(Li+)/H+ antiporter [Nitrososphaeraceae archaeon]
MVAEAAAAAAETTASFLHIVITLSILLFAAKLFAELFHRIKMPVVLGELLAGIVVGPF